MTRYPYCTMLMVVFLLLINLGSTYCHCKEHRCGHHGPVIRFPFYLIDGKTNYSDNPAGFGVTCKDKSETTLELSAVPSPVFLQVQEIDYMSQYITLTDPTDCLPMQFLKINQSSIFHSHFEVETCISGTFFNCSSSSEYQHSCPIQVLDSRDYITEEILKSCSKMFDTATGIEPLWKYKLRLRWSKPNFTYDEIKCSTSQFRSTILIAAGGIIASILVVIALFYIYNYFKTKGEDQARVEIFLEDYRSQKPTRFSYADIKRITNGFKVKLGEGAHGAVFKEY
ncbi:hypothetical protein L6164_002035 [Bauhinia variegata]|uniref:Uncharacterized protein n=1 Tax=Bauhinia variegata TaxID=167791 RepID=A0ACB9PZ24_BAUVA|nr:hypothetical protein L6164_002035 [Bauhinia variegata]